FIGSDTNQCLLPLFSIQHLEQFVRLNCLGPVDVPRMIGLLVKSLGRVAVEDGSAKGNMVRTVAVAADREVTTGHDKFELVLSGFTKNRNGLGPSISSGIVLELLADAVMPVGIVHPEEDGLDQIL